MLLRTSTVRMLRWFNPMNHKIKTLKGGTNTAGEPGRARSPGKIRENLPDDGDPAKRDR